MQTSLRPITTPEADRNEHSPIGFSGWERHSNCHGSVALASISPRSPDTEASKQGTIAHDFAAHWLIRGHRPSGMSAEMAAHVKKYVDAISRELLHATRKGSWKALWLVEGRVKAPSIHEDCWGTVDCLIWNGEERILQVHDLKYGKGQVRAFRNKQLMGYAMCAIEHFPDVRPEKIELFIHQPRLNDKPDKWECDMLDIELFEDEVRGHVAAIEEQKRILAETKDPRRLDLHAGDHCTFCPAWSTCHERIATARREGIDLLMPIPADLPSDAAKIIAFAKQALPWAKNVLAKAKAHLLMKGRIPGVFLAKGKRVRKAKSPATLAEDLMLDVDFGGLGLSKARIYTEPKPPELKSIPQLEKEVSHDPALKKALGELWEWEDGAPTLALDGEDKEPYHVQAKDYFKAIEEDPEGEESESESEDY